MHLISYFAPISLVFRDVESFWDEPLEIGPPFLEISLLLTVIASTALIYSSWIFFGLILELSWTFDRDYSLPALSRLALIARTASILAA